MDPALRADRGADVEIPGVAPEDLDLVVLLELADLLAADLVGAVHHPDDPVADEPALGALDGGGVERELVGRTGRTAIARRASGAQ